MEHFIQTLNFVTIKDWLMISILALSFSLVTFILTLVAVIHPAWAQKSVVYSMILKIIIKKTGVSFLSRVSKKLGTYQVNFVSIVSMQFSSWLHLLYFPSYSILCDPSYSVVQVAYVSSTILAAIAFFVALYVHLNAKKTTSFVNKVLMISPIFGGKCLLCDHN